MENEASLKYLVVGLGNPGKRYEGTRHNIGYEVVKQFASKSGVSFSESKKLQGMVANSNFNDKKIYFLLPLTYMNLSGISVRLCVQFYKIELSHIIIVLDDASIPFGQFRIKENSGSGGQKGLESIIEQLNTNSFPRLRIGIGEKENLSSHVLGKFSQEEKKVMPKLKQRAVDFIELWLEKGIKESMNQVNIRSVQIEQNRDKENGN